MKISSSGIALLSCSLVLLFLAACDSTISPIEDEETRPEMIGQPCFESPEGLTDYFPIALGNTWEYDYSLYKRAPLNEAQEVGTLTWEIQNINCSPEEGTYRIREHWTGTRTVWNFFTEQWDTTAVTGARNITLLEDNLGNITIPYGTSAFNRYQTVSEDSLTVSVGNLTHVFSLGAGHCVPGGAPGIIVPAMGLVRLEGWCSRVSSSSSLKMSLVSIEYGSTV